MNHHLENPATLAGQPKYYEQLFELIGHQEPIYQPADFPVWLAVFAGAMMLTPIAVLVRQIVKRK